MPMSVRLDSRTENAVRRLAREESTTQSQIIREAIACYEEQKRKTDESTGEKRPFESIRHLIGSIDSGDPDLSQNGGPRAAEIVREKHRRRAVSRAQDAR